MPSRLTGKQRRVLNFIQEYYRRHGKEPPYREVSEHMGVTVRAAAQHIEALERKGYLTRKRGIVLNDEYRPAVGIPILGRVAAGRPLLAEENIEGHVQPENFFGVTRDEKFFCLRVRGDSMKDVGIMEGDLLVVRPTRKPAEGDITVVVVGEEATVKIVRMPPGRGGEPRLVLEPANDAYEPLDVTGREDVRIAGRVMASYREY